MRAQLNREGVRVARGTVERHIRLKGRRDVEGGTRAGRTTADDALGSCPTNLVARRFCAEAPNPLYLADLTCLMTDSGWICVVVAIDVCSRFVVGWRASSPPRTDLALDALDLAPQAGRLRLTTEGL